MPSGTDDNMAHCLSPGWVIRRRIEGYPTRMIKIKTSQYYIQCSSVVAPATEDSNTDKVLDILRYAWLRDGCEKVFRRPTAELFCPVGVLDNESLDLAVMLIEANPLLTLKQLRTDIMTTFPAKPPFSIASLHRLVYVPI